MPNFNDPAEDAPLGAADLRAEAFTWDGPDRSLLTSDFGDAPRFPTDMLGPFWSIIRERKWERFTGRQLQHVASGRLADTRNRKATCEILVEAALLRKDFQRAGEPKGRASEEYVVNTDALWPQIPADTAEAA